MSKPYLQLDPQPEVSLKSGYPRSTLYARIAQKLWTRPVKLGVQSRWPAHETEILVAARIAGKSDDEIRALVEKLESERGSVLTQIYSPVAA